MALRLRLAVLAGLAVLVVTGLFAAGVYFVLASQLQGQVDNDVQEHSDELAQRLAFRDESTTRTLVRDLGGDPHLYTFAYDASGSQVGETENAVGLDITPPAWSLRAALAGERSLVTVGRGEGRYRLAVAPVPELPSVSADHAGPRLPDAPAEPKVVVSASWLGPVDSILGTLRAILLAGSGLILLTACGAGWFVAGYSLRPVAYLTRESERLGTADDLGRRLPVPRAHDEVARLTAAFNASLDRLESVYRVLEEALVRQRRFVADASHELRTPLTVILGNAELLRDHPEAPAGERAECLDEILDETQRLAQLSQDLLQLARIDAAAPLESRPFEWDELLREVERDTRRICAPRRVVAELPAGGGSGRGDPAALRAAFRAFADNIRRHTPQTATVTLRATAEAEALVVTVADDGSGVPAALMNRIFDRFYRADPARGGPGSGLGLAIARSVIEAQGGRLVARAALPRGLLLEARLPRRPTAPAAASAPKPAAARLR